MAIHSKTTRPGDAAAVLATSAVVDMNEIQARHRAHVVQQMDNGGYSLEEVPECLCGEERARLVARHDRFGLPVSMLLCTACGLLRTSPRIDASSLPGFYEVDYHGLHMGTPSPEPDQSLFATGQGTAIYERVRPFLPRRDLRVVEVGAGTGSVLREFANRAARDGVRVNSSGCEYSESFAAEGRRLGTDIRHGGMSTLAGTKTPDLIILSHVLEHFTDIHSDIAFLRTISGLETLLYVEVPGILSLHEKAQYDYLVSLYFTVAHTYHFSLATLTSVLGRCGLARLYGDEQVRGIFRFTSEPLPAANTAADYDAVAAYLNWIERSRGQGVRRLRLRLIRKLKPAMKKLVVSLAGEGGLTALRRRRSKSRLQEGA